MKALVTGASSGIGKQMAIYLDQLGYDLILVAKEKEKLEDFQKLLSHNTKIIVTDLSDVKKVKDLYLLIKNDDIDLLINNAGFGLFGDYREVDVLRELEMINVNVVAVHLLTRLVLKDMIKKNKGHILNVASSAGLTKGGPLMSTYYATKSYVTNFSFAIYEELRRSKSNVKISVLAPGPVNTNFNKVANVEFNLKSLSAEYVAKYAIDNMFKNKLLIVPGSTVKLGIFFTRFLSTKTLLKITYNLQRRKRS